MARTTFVKSAQARYKTVPTIDPVTGQQKVTPVLRKDGTPKTNKHGVPTVVRLTHADKTQPLPNHKCGKCGVEITPGSPYKWIKPKSGPYGGTMLVRCATCPQWDIWDYSSSLTALLAQVSHDAFSALDGADDPDAVQAILDDAANAVRDIAAQKQESADNIEDGFGHATYQSDELAEVASSLESWADDIEGTDIPELPEAEDQDCDECSGTGKVENPDYDPDAEVSDEEMPEDEEVDCDECGGTGIIEADGDPSDEQMDEWRNEVQEILAIVDESPV